jgi:CTP:molybdopterin cytidylyltransferase MocA
MNERPTKFAALVLAAGYSSRMGRCKALLPIAGESVLARIVATFRAADVEALDTIAVVSGHDAEHVEPVARALGVDCVANPDYARGMYSSVQAGVRALPADVDACFLLPVDIPLTRAATIAAIATAYGRRPAPITYPRFSGRRGHPPLIARALFAEILAGQGDGGLRALLATHQGEANDVDVLDEGVVLDMDTPSDYEQLAQLALRRHLPTPAECEAILATRPTSDALHRHGRAVTAVARTLANKLSLRGVALDLNLILAASLLHDIAKGEPGHAEVGAALVERLGYPAVAAVIRQHMALSFDGSSINEAAVVFLADKLVQDNRRVTLEQRYAPSFARFAEQPEALAGAQRRLATARAVQTLIERKARAPIDRLLADSGVAPRP